MRLSILFSAIGAACAFIMTVTAVAAQDFQVIGRPVDGKMGFQPAGSPVAADIHWLDGMMTTIMTAIVIFVTVLLLIVIFRFNARANPKPAKFTHNTPLEVAWTIIPIIILVVIGSFSLPVLFKELEPPKADVAINITGNQWFWTYNYTKAGITFDSYMLGSPATVDSTDEKAGVKAYIMNDAMAAKLKKAGYAKSDFLLAVDNPLVVPVGAVVVARVTGVDVIHSWTVPAFGIKQDGVPGRLGETWFKATRKGIYYGQCSELCGKDHAYMPIEVKVVSQADYQAWLVKAKKQFASAAPATPAATDYASAAPAPLRLAAD